MKLLSFAEIIWDVYPDAAVIGGSGLNFCAHAVRCGMEGWLLSAVGPDAYGIRAMAELSRLGMNASLVRPDSHETGKCLVTLDAAGVPSFHVLQNVAYDNVAVTDDDLSVIKKEKFDAFYFGTLQQRAPVSRASILKILRNCDFSEIFCDMNLRKGCYDEESVKNVLQYATVLKLSDEEKPLLDAFGFWKAAYAGEDFATRLFDDYPQLHTVLYTQGAEGSVVYLRTGEMIYVPSCKVQVASTVGAGDSYGAAYLASVLSGKMPEEAGSIAAAVSAKVVSVTDAVPEYSLSDIL